MNILLTPGDRLRQERERLGLTQAEMATRGGVKKLAQLNYEKGIRKPGAAYLLGIAKAGADVNYIVTGTPSALQERLNDIKVATNAARLITGDDPAHATEFQEAVFLGLQGHDERKLLVDYRRCTPPDKKTIRQMAARLAGDAPAEAPNSRTEKRAKERR